MFAVLNYQSTMMLKLRAAYKKVVLDSSKRTGWKGQTLANRRSQVRKGTYPEEPLMRRVVKRAGMRMVQPEMWK